MRLLAPLLMCFGLVACGQSSAPSPFVGSADGGADGGSFDAGPIGVTRDAGIPDADLTLGGPCVDDGQCDDGLECTNDHCDTALDRCRHMPEHEVCQNSVFCDGQERCVPQRGCTPGEPVTCSDDSTCTIDACVESDRSCTHRLRDADEDGDPLWNCGGGDCNDVDPRVSSQASEICGNQVDDDCDGQVDESSCRSPEHDGCGDPLEIAASGRYRLSLAAAGSDFGTSCLDAGGAVRDVVAALLVPEGEARDVDIVATAPSGSLALASVGQCGDSSSERICAQSYANLKGGTVARLRLRALEPGAHPILLFADRDVTAELSVEFSGATAAPVNETCGSATPISVGQSVRVPLVGARNDVTFACAEGVGDLFYTFRLEQTRDVRVFSSSVGGLAAPIVSLRDENCSVETSEIACRALSDTQLFARAVPPGDYFIAVSAKGPSDVDLRLELAPPTAPPEDETCVSAPLLEHGRSLELDLAGHTDDVATCLDGAVDAAYALELSETSDLLIVARISARDTGALSLSLPACREPLACQSSSRSPVRLRRRNVASGDYRVVLESQFANPAILTAYTRPAAPATLVAFADTCDAPATIPKTGGFFEGSTVNAAADYEASCDRGGLSPGGAPDQMLRLELDERQRVILDMSGSDYDTLLAVREANGCPGPQVAEACAAGYVAQRSFLDLTLEPGAYFIQIDGFGGASGAWKLDVHIADP